MCWLLNKTPKKGRKKGLTNDHWSQKMKVQKCHNDAELPNGCIQQCDFEPTYAEVLNHCWQFKSSGWAHRHHLSSRKIASLKEKSPTIGTNRRVKLVCRGAWFNLVALHRLSLPLRRITKTEIRQWNAPKKGKEKRPTNGHWCWKMEARGRHNRRQRH